MGLMSGLLTLPLAPVRGAVWVADQVRKEAERQWSDPGVVQRELAEVQVLRERGALGEEEAAAREEALLQRLLDTSAGWAPARDPGVREPHG